MFPVGGVGVMLLLIAVAAALATAVAAGLSRRFGWQWSALFGLLIFSVAAIGVLTLIPANGAPGVVSAQGRLDHCSWDIGGPAPDGFWILPRGQRLLNVGGFVPAGAPLVLGGGRGGWGGGARPRGVGAL